MVGGGSGRKLNRLSGAVGKFLYATMNTASVVSFRLSGSGTNTVTSPQIPTNPGGQVGVGWRPSWHAAVTAAASASRRSEEHTSELQSLAYLVCRLLLEKKKKRRTKHCTIYQEYVSKRSR